MWYNLAAARATLNKPAEALQDLRRALDLGARLREQNSNAPDLRVTLSNDTRFSSLRDSPEYKALVAPR